MKTQLHIIKKARAIRALILLLFICLCSYFLVLCSQIPCVEKIVEGSDEKSILVELKIKDPSLMTNIFMPHDLSKTEYTLNFPSYSKDRFQPLWITETYDSLFNGGSLFTTNFSEFDNGESQSFTEVVVVAPHSDQLHFYTQNIIADNTQMIRNFFLTEIILFLLALFGKEVYKLLCDVFAAKAYSHQRIFGVKTAKGHFAFYLLLFFVTGVLLYTINIVTDNTVTTNNFIQKSNSLFALHDISCSNHHLQLHINSEDDKTVKWKSEEIVEFTPKSFTPLACKIGPKSLTFSNIPIGQDIDVRFFTRNLQSSNYQEIRLFVLTTLLLFFMERSFFYFRKWMHNRAFVIKLTNRKQ